MIMSLLCCSQSKKNPTHPFSSHLCPPPPKPLCLEEIMIYFLCGNWFLRCPCQKKAEILNREATLSLPFTHVICFLSARYDILRESYKLNISVGAYFCTVIFMSRGVIWSVRGLRVRNRWATKSSCALILRHCQWIIEAKKLFYIGGLSVCVFVCVCLLWGSSNVTLQRIKEAL